ncbi:hypothetical protein BLJAPNOD_06171 [Ensifer sp. M14]|uniref:hypothetical protein n=1 Tax=Ensifer sp. M14 TaxID=2203782 RepID=UPI000E1D2EFB|nr:hypothetical protein [Ensifer sp. M14]RDL47331.1 hypothetical protein BLJAPNOD_06171 [Ensifer sp. M14]
MLTSEKDTPSSPPLKTAYVADQFGLSVADFQRYCQLGLIIVSVDKGACDSRDSLHIKCCLGNRVWQATIDPEGRITFEAMTFIRGKMAKTLRR